MNDARKRRFNCVLVWRFDRFARSTKHLCLRSKTSARWEFNSSAIGKHRHDLSTRAGIVHDRVGGCAARARSDPRAGQGWIAECQPRVRYWGRPRVAVEAHAVVKLRSEGNRGPWYTESQVESGNAQPATQSLSTEV